jgi:hypothetical protein
MLRAVTPPSRCCAGRVVSPPACCRLGSCSQLAHGSVPPSGCSSSPARAASIQAPASLRLGFHVPRRVAHSRVMRQRSWPHAHIVHCREPGHSLSRASYCRTTVTHAVTCCHRDAAADQCAGSVLPQHLQAALRRTASTEALSLHPVPSTLYIQPCLLRHAPAITYLPTLSKAQQPCQENFLSSTTATA